jgi:signal transduction histidine kinase
MKTQFSKSLLLGLISLLLLVLTFIIPYNLHYIRTKNIWRISSDSSAYIYGGLAVFTVLMLIVGYRIIRNFHKQNHSLMNKTDKEVEKVQATLKVVNPVAESKHEINELKDEILQLQHMFNQQDKRYQEFETAKSRVDEMQQCKPEFLTAIMHDIQSSKTAINSFRDLLESGCDEEERVEYLEFIRILGEQSITLINGALRLSQLDGQEFLTLKYA